MLEKNILNKRLALYTPPFTTITSYMEMVDIAEKYGFQAIETINAFELSVPDLEFAKKLRQYADEKNITFACVSVGLDLVGEDREEAIQKVKGYADVTKILGSSYLHHTIAFEFQDPQIIKDNHDLFYERGIAAVREIYDYAESIGIQALYEEQGFLFNGVKAFQQFIQDVDRNIGIVADFGNIMFVDEKVEDFMPHFSDRIMNVHVKDYLVMEEQEREKRPEEYLTYYGNYLKECKLGEGSVDFQNAFEQLKKMNYQGYIALECSPIGEHQQENLEANIQYLNNCIEK